MILFVFFITKIGISLIYHITFPFFVKWNIPLNKKDGVKIPFLTNRILQLRLYYFIVELLLRIRVL